MIMHLILLALFLLNEGLAQNIGYDCASDPSNYTTISPLIEVGSCTFTEDDFHEEKTEIQLIQSKVSMYIDTFSCLINLQ